MAVQRLQQTSLLSDCQAQVSRAQALSTPSLETISLLAWGLDSCCLVPLVVALEQSLQPWGLTTLLLWPLY